MARPKRICSVPDCGKPVEGHGWCNAHYLRWRKYGDPFGGGLFKGETQRFLKETAIPHRGKDCLRWPHADDGKGYGIINFDGRVWYVHRLVCEATHGAPPSPLHQAAHSCGNGHLGCVNPNHLEWKTRKENAADKLIHDTHNRGERHGMAKVTDDEARQILSLKGKLLQREIAEQFMVTKSIVGSIHRRESWAWLE